MVLDGPTIAEKQYVYPEADTLFSFDEQIQPNGIDLRVISVKHVNGRADLPREGRIAAEKVQIETITPKNGWFELQHTVGNYLVDFQEFISVPDGYCAIIITRSSLVRIGCDVISGLWDTGFQGRLGASVRVKNPVRIEYGARMAQVMFSKSLFNGLRYSGGYQGTTQSEFK